MGAELITERDVRRAAQCGGALPLPPGAILSPGAQDAILKTGVKVVETPDPRAAIAAVRDRRVVALAADHAGFDAKEDLRGHLESLGYVVLDFGTRSREPVDYPDFARRAAEAVAEGRAERGIVIDGAGIGSAIAANKVRGIRAAKCDSIPDVKNSREHNDANVLSLGARIERSLLREMARVWLDTPFAGGRHERRVQKIRDIEAQTMASSR